MSLQAKYTQIPLEQKGLFTRSSHCLAVVGDNAYIFGGELRPREPLEADVLVVNLKSNQVKVISPKGTWPSPRVGAAMVANKEHLYVWGGRCSAAMNTMSENEDLWRFDTSSHTWESLTTSGDQPEQRSYHTMTVHNNHIYLHAGCPAKGRLDTLHSLNLSTLEWTTLPSGPAPGRGGTNLTPISSSTLARFGGFGGMELGGLDLYEVDGKKWSEVKTDQEPDKRSVASFLGVDGPKGVKAVLLMGERESAPAELGHSGAGQFHNDAWALVQSGSDYSWSKLETKEEPTARGWFASAAWGNKIIFQGGLKDDNSRLGDMWLLEVII